MIIAYALLALVTAAANIWAASTDFRRTPSARGNAAEVGVPESWLFPLGVLKAAGAVGVLAGIAVPAIGVAGSAGLVLFFVCAAVAHLRVRWYSTIVFPAGFLLLAVATLTLRLGAGI